MRGFRYSARVEEIRKHGQMLTPGRYVGAAETDDDDEEPIAQKIDRLRKELSLNSKNPTALERALRTQLERLDV